MTVLRTSHIAELLEQHRDEILRRFLARARHAGAALALPDDQVLDELGAYLDELVAQLRSGSGAGSGPGANAEAAGGKVAKGHGEHRFLHGYELVGLIREYGALCSVLFDVIIEDGGAALAEIHRLDALLFEGLADAAARYAHLRDAELRRQSSKHIAFLAHELRNPISSALMATRLVRSRVEAGGVRAFDAIVRGLTRAAQLIDDALMTVRLQEIEHLESAPIDLTEVAHDVVADSEEEAEAKNLRVLVEGGATIRGDVKALRSALSNLVRNAVKFSRPGGDVVIRLRPEYPRVIVEVEDSCGGLPPGAKAKTLRPVRADRRRSERLRARPRHRQASYRGPRGAAPRPRLARKG